MGNLSLFHKFCIDVFKHILSNQDKYSKGFDNSIFKYALKDGLIGQYAETYCINGEEMKFWDIDYNSKTHKDLNEWHVLFASEKAIEGIGRSKKEADYPYYEHIEPKSLTYKKLLGIDVPDDCNIEEALRYCKIIMITKEESKYLDSKEFNKFTEKDEEILRSWKEAKYIRDELYNDSIEGIKKNDEYISAKSNGTAYARMAHLVAHGVKFQWHCNPNKTDDAGQNQGKLISQYLESKDRVYPKTEEK